ncbi:MAG: adenylate/guanylate cyclase domain-containing protein [Candidatus Kapaibacterium sp.]
MQINILYSRFFVKHFLCASLFLFAWLPSEAQLGNIDSPDNTINTAKDDTNKVKALIELSKNYFSTEPSLAMKYAVDAKVLAEKLHYPWGMGYALKNIGLIYNTKGNYVDALQTWQQALDVFEANSIKVGVSNMLNNIGSIYFNKSDETKALDYYLRSLTIAEEIKDTLRIATALINIGALYGNKKATYSTAIDYYRQALPFSKATGNLESVGICMMNIGEIFFKWDKSDSALAYMQFALKASEGTTNIPYSLNSIGKVYQKQHEYPLAIRYHRLAYDSAQKLDSKLDMAQAVVELAKTYQATHEYKLALGFYEKAEKLLLELGADASYDLKDTYDGMTASYSALADYPNAFKYQKLLLAIKDSLYNIDVDKKLGTKLFAFEIDKKQGEINHQQELISQQAFVRNALLGGFVTVLLFAGIFFKQRNRIGTEKKRSDALLLNILPEEIAEELKVTGSASAKNFDNVTVMLTDFKAFTTVSELLTPQELVNELHACFSAFDEIIQKHHIEKIKTVGDAYLAICGLPAPNEKHAEHIINAALEIRDFMLARRQKYGEKSFEVRIGINSGNVVAGIVGVKKFAYDIWGDTVNIAARMEQNSEGGKINISETTHQLVQNLYHFDYRGEIDAKNKGQLKMYYVTDKAA